MQRRIRLSLASALAIALAACVTPAAAMTVRPSAAPARRAFIARRVSAAKVGKAVVHTPQLATTTPDAWDSADDTYAAATTLTALPVFNATYAAWGHSFSRAYGTTDAGGDVDWFKFTVGQGELDAAYTYLFEAFTRNTTVDPVIEVYRADASGHVHSTPPTSLADKTEDITRTAGLCQAANDVGFWWYHAGNTASLSYSPDASGTYFVRVRPRYWAGYGFADSAGPYEFRAKVGQLSRIGGANRYAMSVNVSREQFPTNYGETLEGIAIPTVVVANGAKYSDALPAAALAFAARGPLLLLPSVNTVPTGVRNEIRRLGATKVIIVGGTASVSTAMARSLDAIPGVTRIERASGRDRYSNAVAIAKKSASVDFITPFAFVVNGASYPDALSATPISANNIAPILFTHAGYLDSVTANYISSAGIVDVCIVGGTRSVSTAVEGRLKRMLGSTSVRRISGADKYATSKSFAKWACELDVAPASRDGMVGTVAGYDALGRLYFPFNGFASGDVFADALAGGAYAGSNGAPVLLTPGTSLSRHIWEGEPLGGSTSDWYFDVTHSGETTTADPQVSEIHRSYVFGGTATVSGPVASRIDRITGPGPDAVSP